LLSLPEAEAAAKIKAYEADQVILRIPNDPE
jgi:hypothetical protein